MSSSDKVLNIGIAGLGTVGGGVLKTLNKLSEQIEKRAGRRIVVNAVSARNKDKAISSGLLNQASVNAPKWYDNALDIASDKDIDVVVELIGGADGVAKQLCETAISNKKHVVTANKALIAHHGYLLAQHAEKQEVCLSFEAAVAGGIPVIKTLKEGLAGNNILSVAGILNGTCNYILTQMERSRRDFADVLKEAQDIGYAEADPSFDIDGIDTAHKLAILASLAFGRQVDIQSVYVEGIRQISLQDIDFAASLNYRIKLLGVARMVDSKISQAVHAVMVPEKSPLAAVYDAFNAVEISAEPVGNIILEGRGAGEGPTASAVIADIVDIARGSYIKPFGISATHLLDKNPANFSDVKNAFYLRLTVLDKPGVVAEVSSIMRDSMISIESLIQRSRKPNEPVALVMTTHTTSESAMKSALDKIEKLENVIEKPAMIRILDL